MENNLTEVSDSVEGDQSPVVGDQSPAPGGKPGSDIVQRLLGEKKKEQEKRRELESRLTALEQEKLEAEGNKEELIKALKAQVGEVTRKYNQATVNYAEKLVSAQITQKAKDFGCIDTELLTKAIDINELEVGEDFSVDSQTLESQLLEIRKKKPYLFKNDAPKFRDGAPASKGAAGQKPDFSKMSLAEIKAYAVEHGVS
jgi:hypothetical protein